MKLTVAFNGDLKLIEKYAKCNVESIFVKMTEDLVGGGRSSNVLPDIDIKKMAEITNKCHSHNIKVNYVLNSACQANNEYRKEYNSELYAFISELVNINVDGVVVASPFMLSYIKSNWPNLWVTMSVFAFIDTVAMAKFYDENGADRLILAMSVNRNFELLKKIKKAVKCEIELISNLACLYSCPINRFHSCFVTHNSNLNDSDKRILIDYHITNCALIKMSEPAELIKARWIRPDDTEFYEEIGIDAFKVTDRLKNSAWLINAVEAYSNKKYEGNLMDLIHVSLFEGELDTCLAENPNRIKFQKQGELSNDIMEINGKRKNVKIKIDYSKLNKFIHFFTKQDCLTLNCGVDCRYCYNVADKVITVNQEEVDHNVKVLDTILTKMHDRSMFYS